jgi:MFS family permease
VNRARFSVFAASFLAGLGVVVYPASGTLLRSVHPLSDVEWGGLFIAHMVGVVAGSVWGARAESFGSGLAAIASSAGFAVALWLVPSPWASTLLWLGAGTAGLGFGLLAGPLNALPALLYPERPEGALIALHTVQGLGFASGPIAVAWLGDSWPVLPSVLVLAAAGVLQVARVPSVGQTKSTPVEPRALLPFVAVVLLYAVVEGTFVSWAPIYLNEDRGVRPSTAVFAISMFWGGMLLGRGFFAASIGRLGPRRTWLGLPLMMALVLLLLPAASGALSGLLLFAAAGVSCSAFLPLTLAFATKRFAGRESAVASVLIATLSVGIGTGSFLLGTLRDLASFDLLYRLSALFALLVWVILVSQRTLFASPANESGGHVVEPGIRMTKRLKQ